MGDLVAQFFRPCKLGGVVLHDAGNGRLLLFDEAGQTVRLAFHLLESLPESFSRLGQLAFFPGDGSVLSS